MDKKTALKNIIDLIITKGRGNYNIVESEQDTITKYSVINGAEEVCEITLSTGDYKIAVYKEDRWFEDSWHKCNKAISVMFLRSNVKGMGKLMLSYGVLALWEKNPNISYCVLDDDSDNSVYKKNNIYTALSFTPTNKAKDTSKDQGPDRVQLNGPEKQCLLSDFLYNVEKIARSFEHPELPELEPDIYIRRRVSHRIKDKECLECKGKCPEPEYKGSESARESNKSVRSSRQSGKSVRSSRQSGKSLRRSSRQSGKSLRRSSRLSGKSLRRSTMNKSRNSERKTEINSRRRRS